MNASLAPGASQIRPLVVDDRRSVRRCIGSNVAQRIATNDAQLAIIANANGLSARELFKAADN